MACRLGWGCSGAYGKSPQKTTLSNTEYTTRQRRKVVQQTLRTTTGRDKLTHDMYCVCRSWCDELKLSFLPTRRRIKKKESSRYPQQSHPYLPCREHPVTSAPVACRFRRSKPTTSDCLWLETLVFARGSEELGMDPRTPSRHDHYHPTQPTRCWCPCRLLGR